MSKVGKQGGVPQWVGRFPYPPDQKRALVVGNDGAVLFTFGQGQEKVSCIVHISTDLIQIGIMIITPGGTFDPPDIHAGDEVYYINSGEIAVFDPESGRTIRARQGEVVLIPKGIWHQAYNTSSENLEVLAFIAPLQWRAGETEVPSEFAGQTKCLSDNLPLIPPMGNWPASKTPKQQSIQRLAYSDAFGVVRGERSRLPTFFYVSNANIHVGEFSLPVRWVSDLELHNGDEVLFVLAGVLGVHVWQSSPPEAGPLQEVHEVRPGQAFLIPQGCKHQYVNFDAQPTRVIFAIAPKM